MGLAQEVQHDLRMDVYNRIQSREIAFFEEHRLGEILAMLNDDVNQLERFLNTGFNELVQLAVLFVFAFAVMFPISWQLSLVAMAPDPGDPLGEPALPAPHRAPLPAGARGRRGASPAGWRTTSPASTSSRASPPRRSRPSGCAGPPQEYQRANFEAIRLSAVYTPLIRMAHRGGLRRRAAAGELLDPERHGQHHRGRAGALRDDDRAPPLAPDPPGHHGGRLRAGQGERPPCLRPAGHRAGHPGPRRGPEPLGRARGEVVFDRRRVPLRPRPGGRARAPGRELPHRPGRDPGDRRPDGRRQVDADQAPPPLLRRHRRRRASSTATTCGPSAWPTCGATSPW